VIEADLRNQPREPLPTLGAADRLTQVFIYDQHALLGPAQCHGAARQPVLEVG
jgi:hypothetical protein